MGYKTECENCGDLVDEPFLMGQFHEDEFLSNELGDRLKEAGYDLTDTITFCDECTFKILVRA
ncbi:hypothetical protein [Haloarcula onubensis]|uniref:Small CPxCG-related zinc finger protein n=1 Tax=Haloarcula onubensis TaxID=2950539 RepID=A0ABU2FWV3_9EURY|nr:hypothetical protein [Halomicroarcula sp. S3CR25-11]MDS0284726.1 hypothetical protein [Halomicroarcula sp. S3CR25-11]